MKKRLVKWTPEIAKAAKENKVKCLCLKIIDNKYTHTFLIAFGPSASVCIDAVIAQAKPQGQPLLSQVEESKGPVKAEPKSSIKIISETANKKAIGEPDMQAMPNELIRLAEKKINLEKSIAETQEKIKIKSKRPHSLEPHKLVLEIDRLKNSLDSEQLNLQERHSTQLTIESLQKMMGNGYTIKRLQEKKEACEKELVTVNEDIQKL